MKNAKNVENMLIKMALPSMGIDSRHLHHFLSHCSEIVYDLSFLCPNRVRPDKNVTIHW